MTLYGPERRAHEQGRDDPLANEIADMREWRAQKYMPIYDCVVRISQPIQAGRVRFPGGSYDPTAGPPETVTRYLKEYVAHMEEAVRDYLETEIRSAARTSVPLGPRWDL